MAADTEIQKLNTTAEKILKSLYGSQGASPADQKRLEDQKAETTKDLAAAAKALKSSAEDEKKKEPQKKKALEKKETSWTLMGQLFSGMKKSADSYFEKTNENMITWGGLGNAIKSSVKNWFDKTIKSQTLLGATLRFAAGVVDAWKAAAQQFSKVFSAIGSHVREVLGPIAAVFDVVKDALVGTFNFFKSLIGGWFERVPPQDRKRNKFLQKIVKELMRARKAKFTEGMGKKEAFLERLKSIGGIFKIVGSLILSIAAFAVVLYGAWQFFKGFKETPGEFWDKLKGGYSRAIKKLLYWPLKLFEWLFIQMGIDAQGMTDAVLGWVDPIVDYLVDFNPFKPLIEFIKGFMGEKGTFWEKIKAGFHSMAIHMMKLIIKWHPIMMEAISPIIEGVVGFFKGLWNSAVDWIIDMLDGVPFTSDVKEWLEGMKLEGAGGTESPGGEVDRQNQAREEAEKKRLEEERKAREEQERIAKEQLEAQRLAAENAAIAAGGQGGQGGSSTESPPQIPDEVDNWGLTSKNYDMEAMG